MGKIAKVTEEHGISERPTKADFNLAIKVSDRIQLQDVRLMSCRCEQSRFIRQTEKNFLIDKSTQTVLDKESNCVFVFAQFRLDTFETTKDKDSFAVIEAAFLIIYQVDNPEGLTQEDVDQFGKINGVYNAWPYWREFAQNTIVRMGLPALTIPVFRILPPQKEKLAEKETVKVESKRVVKKAVPKT